MDTVFFGKILGFIVFAVINILAINNYAYDSAGNVQCNNYVLNTYLYAILGFVIIGFMILIDSRFNLIKQYIFNPAHSGLFMFIIISILLLIMVYVLMTTTPEEQTKAHIIWLITMVLLGILLSITVAYYSSNYKNIIQTAVILTILLTAITGFLGYKYGASWMSVDFEKWLRWALIALVILSAAGFFIRSPTFMDNYFDFLAGAGLIIFTLLLFAYHKNIRINAETCKKPLYPAESFGLIIKIVNLLQDILRLLARSSRR